jgi:hypothetical protein
MKVVTSVTRLIQHERVQLARRKIRKHGRKTAKVLRTAEGILIMVMAAIGCIVTVIGLPEWAVVFFSNATVLCKDLGLLYVTLEDIEEQED